jgi:hypothetical protein
MARAARAKRPSPRPYLEFIIRKRTPKPPPSMSSAERRLYQRGVRAGFAKAQELALKHCIVFEVTSHVMTPLHTRWPEFITKLKATKCGHSYSHSTKILKDMKLNVDLSIAFFRQHGGYCDCEIVWNVARGVNNVDTRPQRRREA